MGLSFLTRKKKNKAGFILEDDDDDIHGIPNNNDQVSMADATNNSNADFTVSHMAVLQQATSYDDDATSTILRSRSQKFGTTGGSVANTSSVGGSPIKLRSFTIRESGSVANNSVGVITPINKVRSSKNQSKKGIAVSKKNAMVMGGSSTTEDEEEGTTTSNNDDDGSTPTTVAPTPSPSTIRKSRVVSPPTTSLSPPNSSSQEKEATPITSNVQSLEKDANLFSHQEEENDEEEGNNDGIENSSLPIFRNRQQQQEEEEAEDGLPKNDNKKKQKKKKSLKKLGSRFFIQPSKRDTVPISPERTAPPSKKKKKKTKKRKGVVDNNLIVVEGTDKVNDSRESSSSRYQSHILEYDDNNSREAGIELELELSPLGLSSNTSIGVDVVGNDTANNTSHHFVNASNFGSSIPDYHGNDVVGTTTPAENNLSSSRNGSANANVAAGGIMTPITMQQQQQQQQQSARRNLESLFNSASEDDEDVIIPPTTSNAATAIAASTGANPPPPPPPPGPPPPRPRTDPPAATTTQTETTTSPRNKSSSSTSGGGSAEIIGLGYLSPNEKKFLSRLKRRNGTKKQQQQGNNNNSNKATRSKKSTSSTPTPTAETATTVAAAAASAAVPPPIPEVSVTHYGDDDQASMPSLLTEPEMRNRSSRSRGSRGGGGGGGGGSSRANNSRVTTPTSQEGGGTVYGGGNNGGVVIRGGGGTPTFPSNQQADRMFSSNVVNSITGSTTRKGGGGGRMRSHRSNRSSGRSIGRFQSHTTDNNLVGATSTTVGEDEEETGTVTSNTYLGRAADNFTNAASTVASTLPTSTAAAAGGIEQLFNAAFGCNEDTVISVLKCEAPLCAILEEGLGCGEGGGMVKDGVDLMLEEEEQFALEFQRDIIKNGIKLIYHESPSRASTNPDWIQSTIKLFIRPGNAMTAPETSIKQPMLAWAILPVVSQMQLVGSYESLNDGAMWSTLGLLDVHSILIDEDTGGADNNNYNTTATTTVAAASTGFFSITANNGSVYVFEAPSGKQRDYVVMGLRAVISRLTYHVIAGDTTAAVDVIGELYSEDAGQLTGELPSLVSPWKALGRVTHAFLDQQ